MQASFLEQFPDDTFFQAFAQFQHAAGNGPVAAKRFAGAADQQGAITFDHDAADAEKRAVRIFAGRSHLGERTVMRGHVSCHTFNFRTDALATQLTSYGGVYNTLHGRLRASRRCRANK